MDLYLKLKNNRDKIYEYIIPNNLKKEFITRIYSDYGLRTCVQEYFKIKKKDLSEEGLKDFLYYYICGLLAIKGFGARLIVLGINPKDIVIKMLQEIQ